MQKVSSKLLSALTLLHSERPKLYAILVFLSAAGLRQSEVYLKLSALQFPTILLILVKVRHRSS